MKRRRTIPKAETPVPDQALAPRILLASELFDLLKSGKTKCVLTTEQSGAAPSEIIVATLFGVDEIRCKVLNSHRCFGGYLPAGYPAGAASKGQSIVFYVEIIQPKYHEDERSVD